MDHTQFQLQESMKGVLEPEISNEITKEEQSYIKPLDLAIPEPDK